MTVAASAVAAPGAAPRFSARAIAAAVTPGRPPTDEQAAVIEAAWDAPCVVVAGAGSGKTETMSARVVWLVANGFVRPEQVLGLTFTRKAAHELGERIRRRLRQLRQVGLLEELLLAGDVTVSTYDAYAGRVVSEHSLRLGEEPGRTLITDAVAWQIATRVAESYGGDMMHVDKALSTVVHAVMDLHDEMTGHLVEPAVLTAFTEQFIGSVLAVPDAPRVQGPYAGVKAALNAQRARLQLLPLVERFRAEKRRRVVLDFGDQAALAARLADSFPEIGASERDRFRVVLLDEYQDTSHAQLVMLRGLFGGGHPVTAVGDPCQSIYGWRGASARTISAFAGHFPTIDGRPARQRSLTVSFRNGPHILRAANVVSDELRGEVPELRAWHGNPADRVVVALHETIDDEAADVARRARAEWDRAAERPTIAVLVRKRMQIARIVDALHGVGLPVEVVGVGGLLTTAEVADLRATLQVLADPTRGDALMRVLTGARWRIGPRDLDALGRWARRLARLRDGAHSTQRNAASIGSTLGVIASNADAADDTIEIEPDEVDERSIVDAVDALPPSGWFSDAGRGRLTRLAAELRGLRARANQPLPDLVADVVYTLRLDIELASELGEMGTARANIDAFLDVAADFARGGTTRRCRPSSPISTRPSRRSAASHQARSRCPVTVCRCSPCTAPRGWSGRSCSCPALSSARFRPAARPTRHGSVPWARCRSHCVGTGRAFRLCRWPGPPTRRPSTSSSPSSRGSAASSAGWRSVASPTWQSPAQSGCWSARAIAGAPASGPSDHHPSCWSCVLPARRASGK